MSSRNLELKSFVHSPISVQFHKEPFYAKKPTCPDGFVWRDQSFSILQCLSTWVDFKRRGRMARNMQPQHAVVAERRGSWGVGRFYYEVETADNRFFRIYYDRSPNNALDRDGNWFLAPELMLIEE